MICIPRVNAARLATLTCVAVLCVTSPSRAQLGWTGSITTISGIARSIGDVRLAVDATGAVTAVWVEEASTAMAFTVKASRKVPGGAWSAPVSVSSPLLGADATVVADAAGAYAVWTSEGGVYAARYSGGAWGAVTTIAARGNAHDPDAALDSASNATVVWHIDGTNRVEAVRYTAGTSTWGTVVDLGSGKVPQVAVDPAGNAVAIWGSDATPAAVQAARYTAAIDTWGPPITLATAQGPATDVGVAMTQAGDAFAVWTAWNNATIVLQTAVYNSYTGAWNTPVTLQTTTLPVVPTATVVSARDSPVIAWTMSGQSPMFSHLNTLSGSWSPPLPIAQVGPATSVDLAADGLDGVLAVWQLADGRVQASRCFETQSVLWGPPVLLSPAAARPRVAVAPTGAGTVIWAASAQGVAAVQGTDWVATLGAPRITGATASAGTLVLEFTGPPGPTWPGYSEQTYEYSVDDGVTWAARVPPSTSSPIVIGGLTDFTPYRLRLRVVNIAGPGSPSTALAASAGPGTDAPSGLTVTDVDGSIVTLSWVPPRIGAAPTGYVLEGGVAPGQTLASLDTGSAAPTLTVDAPAGVFYLRVRAVTFNYLPPRVSAASNEIRLVVGVPDPPSAPAHLLGLVDGSTLALSWTNTFSGGEPTGMQLLVSGTLSGSASLPLSDTFVFPNVPPGTYMLQVTAVNAAGASAPSNGVTLTFPNACTGVPAPPTLFVAEAFDNFVVAAWSPPDTGAAVTSYTLSATGTYAGAVATTERALGGVLPPGTYTFRVVATNPCGASASAPPQTVIVP